MDLSFSQQYFEMMSGKISRYGRMWAEDTEEIAIEMAAIVGGGWHKDGLPHHYERMRKILWPELDNHRWEELCRNEIIKNKVTVLMGPASSGKTHSPAWIYLCEYYCFPEEMLVLCSSTDLRGLELRVWGEIKNLHTRAQERVDWLPGNLVDSKHCITTDDVDVDGGRDLRKGIIGIPCVQNGKFIGLGKYAGIKQKKIRLIADEAQFMGASFLSALANLDKNPDFRATIIGNPNDPLDPLGKAAEPLDGWTNHLEPQITCVWKTRFMDGYCVNLVGTDSPNFDYPENEPTRFPYLISREKIERTLSFFAKDSIEYYSQCIGVMKVGMLARRVLTRELCRQFNASEPVIWKGSPRTKVAALDASYGGDRCIFGIAEFGEDLNGKTVLVMYPYEIIPILVNSPLSAEDQISTFVKLKCEAGGVKPENFFHDSTGRGSLGTSLARIWSPQCNPVEFGGPSTQRPVTNDFFIDEDVQTSSVGRTTVKKRLKTCYEHYVKFVTELWFSVRYCVEAGQMRGMADDVIEEFCLRQWDRKKGEKIEIETKAQMKERVGRSPDLADWCAIIVEGARRLGLKISKLTPPEKKSDSKTDALSRFQNNFAIMQRARQLTAR
jgi:hypothetical protein